MSSFERNTILSHLTGTLKLGIFFDLLQVVTGMEAEKIIESLATTYGFLRVPNAACISHVLLIDLWICDIINVYFWSH